jgi:hypothetical protein
MSAPQIQELVILLAGSAHVLVSSADEPVLTFASPKKTSKTSWHPGGLNQSHANQSCVTSQSWSKNAQQQRKEAAVRQYSPNSAR